MIRKISVALATLVCLVSIGVYASGPIHTSPVVRIGSTAADGSVGTSAIVDASVTYAKIQNVAGLSLVGRSANTSGVSAAITGTDGQIARVSGTALGFGKILTAFITGTATNDDAAAGDLGEVIGPISRVRSNALAMTDNTVANVGTTTSITLTPGDWLVTGGIGFLPGATTQVTQVMGAVSTTSSTLPVLDTAAVPSVTGNYIFGEVSTVTQSPSGQDTIMALPGYRVKVATATTTTLYLVGWSRFTVSTQSVYGSLSARRFR